MPFLTRTVPVVLALALLAPTLASAAVIGFDHFDPADSEQPLPSLYTEDGFNVAPGTQPGFNAAQFQLFRDGNPPPSIFFVGRSIDGVHVLTITRAGGGLFSFQSIDFKVGVGATPQNDELVYSFQGCADTACTQGGSFVDTELVLGGSGNWVTILNGTPNAPILELRISGYLQNVTLGSTTHVITDNIVVTAVDDLPPAPAPAPGVLWLLAGGVLTMLGSKRRGSSPASSA